MQKYSKGRGIGQGWYGESVPHGLCANGVKLGRHKPDYSRNDDVFGIHRKRIAIDTLRMPDAMVGVMGGMNKIEARSYLKSCGYSDKQIENIENSKKPDYAKRLGKNSYDELEKRGIHVGDYVRINAGRFKTVRGKVVSMGNLGNNYTVVLDNGTKTMVFPTDIKKESYKSPYCKKSGDVIEKPDYAKKEYGYINVDGKLVKTKDLEWVYKKGKGLVLKKKSKIDYMMGASYPTKKDLKSSIGKPLRYVETSMFGEEYRPDGSFLVVGPDAYTNRKWFAKVTMKNGLVEKVE